RICPRLRQIAFGHVLLSIVDADSRGAGMPGCDNWQRMDAQEVHMGQKPKSSVPDSTMAVSRRTLIGAGAGIVTTALGCSSALREGSAKAADPTVGSQSARRLAAFHIRERAAQAHLDEAAPTHKSNGDEVRYPDKRASFSKTLPHNDAGEVDVGAFETFAAI